MDSALPIKTISRRRDAFVALGAGLVMFVLAFNAKSLLALGRISLVALLSICLISAIAAGIAASLLPLNKLPKETGLPLAGKTGARTGLMSSFLAAGMLVMGVHLNSFTGALLVWLPAVLSILPGALAGIVASALIGSGVDDNQVVAANTTLSEEPGGSGWTFGVFGLGLFGLISPLILPSVAAKPIAIVDPSMRGSGEILAKLEPEKKSAPPPAPVVESKPAAPPPPPFTFKPDPELAKAKPECWNLRTTEHLNTVDASPDSPVALSPSGHSIACLVANGNGQEVQLFNLLTLKQEKSWRIEQPAAHFSFSADGKRILVLGSGTPPSLTVAKEDGSRNSLPLLEPLPSIDSGLEWSKDMEAVLHRSGNPALVLNLETLLPSEDAARIFSPKLPEGATWRFSTGAVSHFSQNPAATGTVANWRVSRDGCLAIAHPGDFTSRLFPLITLSEGERLLATMDGNILLRFTKSGVIAHYFERRDPPPLDFEVTMPHEPGKFPEGSPLREADGWQKLRVMAYAPLLNPLTGKCIGPSRSTIFARARIVSWEGTKARLRLSEIVDKLPSDAVFADPHIESNGSLELAGLEVPHRWWCAAGEPMKDAPAPAAEQRAENGMTLRHHRGAFRIDALPSLKSTPATPKIAPAPPDLSEDSISAQIRKFVLDHHAKATRGDWAAEVDDYAFSVNYFDRGMTSREMVAKDQEAYHARYDTKETVVEPIAIQQVTPDTFDVKYSLISEITEAGKPPRTVRSNVFLLVLKVERRFMIMAHNPKR